MIKVSDYVIKRFGRDRSRRRISGIHTGIHRFRSGKAIAKGVIKSEFGPIDINEDTSHVDLYLFDNVDPSSGFQVVEKWEKNG